MRSGSGAGAPGGDPWLDPYDTGRDWPIERLAGTYGLDPADLRRTLNLADHVVRTVEAGLDVPRKRDLGRIAACAAALTDALEDTLPGSLASLLLVHRDLHPADVLNDLQGHRERLVGNARRLAEAARSLLDGLAAHQEELRKQVDEPRAEQGADERRSEKDRRRLKTPQRKPRSGRTAPPTGKELAVVGLLSDLWLRAHGKRPGVNYRRGGKDADRRVPDAGGRFVVAVAAELFGLAMTDQRLRTVLAHLKRQRKLGAGHRDRKMAPAGPS